MLLLTRCHDRRQTFDRLQGDGLSEKQMALCDDFVYIPQYGQGTASLNVTVAASIVLHQFAVWAQFAERQRTGYKYDVAVPPPRTTKRGERVVPLVRLHLFYEADARCRWGLMVCCAGTAPTCVQQTAGICAERLRAHGLWQLHCTCTWVVRQHCPAGEVPPAPEELERIREERRLRREATSQPQADTGEACVGVLPCCIALAVLSNAHWLACRHR